MLLASNLNSEIGKNGGPRFDVLDFLILCFIYSLILLYCGSPKVEILTKEFLKDFFAGVVYATRIQIKRPGS